MTDRCNKNETESELMYDDLSDAPNNTCDENEFSDSSNILELSDVIRRRISLPKKYNVSSESEDSKMEADEPIIEEWTNEDTFPNLEPFEGICGASISLQNNCSVKEAVDCIFGNEFFQIISEETNRYHFQNVHKYKASPKQGKWRNVSSSEIKNLFGIFILMGQIRKENIKEYWSVDPYLATPIFSKLMSRNRFEQVTRYLHFNDNTKMNENSDRLYKIDPVYKYLTEKFKTVYTPHQNLSLDEAMIAWRGKLKFKTYNPRKLTKYGILVRVLSESQTGYICNMEIYCGQGKKLQDTVTTILTPYFGYWHHLYMDNYYNTLNIAEFLLQNKMRICGTIRANRLPRCLKTKSLNLKKGESIFKRKGDILLQLWKDKREVRMISTIHKFEMVECTGKYKTMQKPKCIADYNLNMNGVDLADQYLSYYSILRKTIKWPKKVVLYLVNCGLFNAFKIYNSCNNEKMKYKDFLLVVMKLWTSEKKSTDTLMDIEQSISNTTNYLHINPSCRLSGNMKQHILEPITSTGKKKFPTKQCKVCSSNKKRSETRYCCKLCRTPLHKGVCFTKYHTLKNYSSL